MTVRPPVFPVLLSLIALALLAAPRHARADEIADLEAMHESMVVLEARLLDRRDALRAALDTPGALLIRLPDGDISYVRRNDVRDMAGQIYDWAQHWDVQEALSPFLSDEINSLMRDPLGRAGGRIRAANMAEDLWLGRQEELRAAAIRQLQEIDRRLDDARTIAASVIEQRDARKAARDRVGVIDLTTCLDPDVPSDGEALVASIGYGGAKYPAKGQFICTGTHKFLWDSGHTIREYRCETPQECFLFSEMTYTTDRYEDTGYLVYWLEDQRTHITFFYK